ncbi:MAG: hypothetical protein OEL76_15860 [Siculibacillus sp.]|nr:hypothetical protein [Siculibacillus sp.]
MLEISGFDVVATISVRARLTVLARAEKPANIAGSTPTIRRVLERYRGFVNYREAIDHAALDRGDEAAAIGWDGPRRGFHLNTVTRRPIFSMEPTWNPSFGPRLAARAADRRARVIAMAARRCRLPIWPEGPRFTHPRSG